MAALELPLLAYRQVSEAHRVLAGLAGEAEPGVGRGAVVPVDVAEPAWEQRGVWEIRVPWLKLGPVELVRRQPVG